MGFFGKKDSNPDIIEDAPPEVDSEKQCPSHDDTALPQIPGPIIKIDPAVEASLLRKLDWRVPTLLGFFLVLASLDRSNIGNAKIAGMETDLNLSSDSYSWLLTIFYISYCVFEVLGLMWKVVPPHQWAAFTVFSWGVVSTCQAAAQNWQGMMALRFLMGIFEAGFGPGVAFLLSFFYRRHEMGLRCGMYVAAAPLASTFAGALAYGITSGHPKLTSWRLLFLVEGIPTCLAAILGWFFLPDTPASAKFLTEEEKEVARMRAIRRTGETEHKQGGLVWKELGATLLDAKAWITALMYFSCNVSYSSLPVFLPTILNDMGFSSINAQGLTAPPYFLSFFVTLFTTWVADRIQQRGFMIAFLSIIGAVGYILQATCTSVAVRYVGVFLSASGVYPSIGNLLPWVVNNQGSDSRRGMSVVILNVIGQCGPFLGTNIFPSSESPRYIKGQSICAAFMFFNTLLALSLRGLLMWENKRLDKKYGSVVKNEKQDQTMGDENYGASFRYVL